MDTRDRQANTPVRSYQFSPVYISSTRRNDRDTDYKTEAAQFPNREENAVPLSPLVICSPADLIKLVRRRKSSDGDNISDVSLESSISEDEFSKSSEKTTSESTTTRSSSEADNLEAMDRDFLEAHQQLLSTMAGMIVWHPETCA